MLFPSLLPDSGAPTPRDWEGSFGNKVSEEWRVVELLNTEATVKGLQPEGCPNQHIWRTTVTAKGFVFWLIILG